MKKRWYRSGSTGSPPARAGGYMNMAEQLHWDILFVDVITTVFLEMSIEIQSLKVEVLICDLTTQTNYIQVSNCDE